MDFHRLLPAALAAACVLGRTEARSDGPAGNQPPPAESTADLPDLLQAHNRERAKAKLPPLKVDPKLQAAALEHARDMAAHAKMEHEGSDGSTPAQRVERHGYHFRKVGENVAAGQSTVAEAMKTWMNSPPHKKDILGDFSELGAAVATGEDGTPYWCVDFGLPMPVLDPDEAETGLVDALNRERARAGKPPFTISRKLHDAAHRHAQATAKAETLDSKDNPGIDYLDRIKQSGYRYRTIAGLAASGSPTPSETLKTWLDQPSQRKLLLEGGFTAVGAGYATTAKGVPYWSLIVARPLR
jgi:uncharacterized protein YkwD